MNSEIFLNELKSSHKIPINLIKLWQKALELKLKFSAKQKEQLQLINDLKIKPGEIKVSTAIKTQLDGCELTKVKTLVEMLVPWRKGPFQLGELKIDAQWDSSKKWRRIEKILPKELIHKKVVADIGCNNGYTLWKIKSSGADQVIGCDPIVQNWLQHKLVLNFADAKSRSGIHFLPLDFASFLPTSPTFDLIFFMGILYHHPSPIDQLRTLNRALINGGFIILETMTFDHELPVALFPRKKYAGMTGVYFIPSKKCLTNFLERSGFFIETEISAPTNDQEQRKTPFAPHFAFSDGIHPQEISQTIEGYPRPYRIAIRAKKRTPV